MPKIDVKTPETVFEVGNRVAFKICDTHGAVGRVIGIKDDELAVEIDRGLAAKMVAAPECRIIRKTDAFICPEGYQTDDDDEVEEEESSDVEEVTND